MLVLTHFKGHTVGGFGGSLKNISIGCASGKLGKQQIHQLPGDGTWPGGPLFMERMVEGGKMPYQSFWATYYLYQRAPEHVRGLRLRRARRGGTHHARIWGSLPRRIFWPSIQASVDMVYALPEAQRRDLVERIESRSGLRQLEYMKLQGMGNNQYDLITV